MNEFYAEHLLKKKSTLRDYAIKVLLIALVIYSCRLVTIHFAFVIVPILLLGMTVIMFFALDIEYEYFYMNGTLEIDRISSKLTRRKIFEMKINELEVLVPEGGFEVQPYRSVKVRDFTSKRNDRSRYEMVVSQNGKKIKLLLEPGEQIVESMKQIAPKKVRVS